METQLTEQSKQSILAAAHALNAVCDGARDDDGHGFNKGDTDWFKYWLSRVFPLRDETIIKMYEKMRLYRKQLLNYGFDYETLTPVFEEKSAPKAIEIDPTWREFKLSFGKYQGKSLAEVVVSDRSYLEFINIKFNDGPIREAVKAVLAGQPIGTKLIPKEIVPQEVKIENKNDYIIIDVDNSYSKIVFHSSKSYKDQIKEISGVRWNEDEDYKWKVSINSLDEVLEAFPKAPRSEKLKTYLKQRDALKARSRAMVHTREFDLGNFGHGLQLMPFQKAALEFMEIAKGRVLLADEMGCGKTIEIMSYLQLHPEIRPAIVVCPASIKFNWRNELACWMSLGDKIQVAKRGVMPKRKIDRKTKEVIIDSDEAFTGDILIINYDILGKWADRIRTREPQIIIFDESHLLKNRKAGRTVAAVQLSENIPHKILASGTPMLSRPAELYTQLHIINPRMYPADGLNFMKYARKYCDAKQVTLPGTLGTYWDTSGASNIDKLADELKTIMIRRTKSDVLSELPEKRRSSIIVEMTNKAKYRKQIDEFGKWLMINRGKDASAVQAINQIEYLKQMCVEGKMEAAIDYLRSSFIETETKVIVFATHVDTISKLMEAFKDVAVKIDGSTKQEDRELATEKFQNDPKTLMFVGNMQAAGVGLTLTAASNVVFLELGWTPALHDQAEDRAHRIGQKNAVNVNYILAADSIDVMLMALLEHKRKIVVGAVGDDEKLNFRLFTRFYDEWKDKMMIEN